jgi:TolB-like protein
VDLDTKLTLTRLTSNPEQWRRFKDVLANALDQPSLEARTAVLRQACAGNTTLLREAEKLLAQDTALFEEFAEFAASCLRRREHDRIGERLGAYAIVREFGCGGMGMVYLAERADGEFEKQVAIKVLKRGTDTDEVLGRFRMERQILAKLEHPNITRLLDAGTTADGLPYFVMEFVKGTPITQFVEQENVGLPGRLKLFLKVCAAVDLAHRHHIIHRDIKPRNVLVNEDGEPKLLDFGIAKKTDSDDAVTTVAAERRLTPQYAAPEQKAGHPATITADVYSLGALLYELLTGHPPPDHQTQPRLPSQVVRDPKRKQQLQGKLDQIVATAMVADPGKRYASANNLAADIKLYLNGAMPRAEHYSAAVTASRRRWSIAAAGVGGIALAGALLLPLRTNVSKLKTIKPAITPPGAASARVATVPSIAVLPFENLSEEKENAYFADGIQGDILTSLSKIGGLKVISRRSVMAYRGKASDVREIGKALDVSTILEGSVRRSGNRVRVNVQLINARNDEQIWAEDYDRDLTDVFAIQTDLAQKIANELQAKLSSAEKARIEHKPTENAEAYLAFVQAENLAGAFEDIGKIKQSELLYERAIALDPKFALALARCSIVESWIGQDLDRTPARKEKARALAERALDLHPDCPEGHLALGFSHYYGDKDYNAALTEFEIARSGLPNESEVYLALGAIERRQGKWEESTSNLEKAVSLNPKDVLPLENLALNYQMLRKFDAANETIERALKVEHNNSELWQIKAALAISEKGDLRVVEKALAAMNPLPTSSGEQKVAIATARAKLLLALRRYEELIKTADNLPNDPGITVTAGSKFLLIGIARKAMGDQVGARIAFLQAKEIAETQLKQSPDDVDACIHLALALAWLGEKDAALAKAQRATELLPESKDSVSGPEITEKVAAVHAILHDNERAIELLDGLLSRPSWATTQALRVDPVWDPLRNDPRFQTLLNKYDLAASNR